MKQNQYSQQKLRKMKKIICLTIYFLLISFLAKAQIDVQFGLKAGTNLNFTTGYYWDYHLAMNIQAEEVYGDGMSVGVIAGGFAILKLSEKFGFKAEVNFMTKTYKTTYYLRRNNVNSYTYHEDDATIIEIPVLLVYSPFSKLSFTFGPGINLISTDRNEIATTELCLNAGIQYHINNNLNVEGRFNGGLTNLYSGDGIGLLDLQPVLNSLGPHFTVSYSF
jgi:hypothetical protein